MRKYSLSIIFFQSILLVYSGESIGTQDDFCAGFYSGYQKINKNSVPPSCPRYNSSGSREADFAAGIRAGQSQARSK